MDTQLGVAEVEEYRGKIGIAIDTSGDPNKFLSIEAVEEFVKELIMLIQLAKSTTR